MKFKEIHKNFLDLENEFDLFNLEISEVKIWERIRFKIMETILKELNIFNEPQTKFKHNYFTYFRMGFNSLKNIILKNPFLTPEREILFIGHQRRKLQKNGKWWDIYCDPIINSLKHSYVLIEYYNLYGHLTPPQTQNIAYFDFPIMISFFKQLTRLSRISISKAEKRKIKLIQNEFNKRFGIEIPFLLLIKKSLLFRKSFLPLCKRILQKIKPRLVIVVVSYTHFSEVMIEACKQLKIPVVELQHGVISPYHYGYSFPKNIAKSVFPDYLLTFGDFWRNAAIFPIDEKNIISVGYPFLEASKKNYMQNGKKSQVLFISQGAIGKELSKIAVKISKLKNKKFKIVYKLHPGEYDRWREEYPWLLASEVNILENDSISLYKLFSNSNIQIGVFSTAIFEGFYFGLRTYLIDLPGIEYMEHILEKGYAKLMKTDDDLAKNLSICDSFHKFNTEIFFKSNSLKNISIFIDQLLEHDRSTIS